ADNHAAADQPISRHGQKLLASGLCRLLRPDAGFRHHSQPDWRGGAGHRARHGDLSRPVAGDPGDPAALRASFSLGDGAMSQPAFLRTTFAPSSPPPKIARDFLAHWRQNLFGDLKSSLVSVLIAVLAVFALPPLWRFLVTDAVWSAPDGVLCRAPGAGACWAYIKAKTPFFLYGSYPQEFTWRVDLAFALAAILIVWLLWPRAKHKGAAAMGFFVILPLLGFALLHGAPWLGLPVVGTHLWGGVMVSLLAALAGIVVALPGGIVLALGRRSNLPVARVLSAGLIEFVRG